MGLGGKRTSLDLPPVVGVMDQPHTLERLVAPQSRPWILEVRFQDRRSEDRSGGV